MATTGAKLPISHLAQPTRLSLARLTYGDRHPGASHVRLLHLNKCLGTRRGASNPPSDYQCCLGLKWPVSEGSRSTTSFSSLSPAASL